MFPLLLCLFRIFLLSDVFFSYTREEKREILGSVCLNPYFSLPLFPFALLSRVYRHNAVPLNLSCTLGFLHEKFFTFSSSFPALLIRTQRRETTKERHALIDRERIEEGRLCCLERRRCNFLQLSSVSFRSLPVFSSPDCSSSLSLSCYPSLRWLPFLPFSSLPLSSSSCTKFCLRILLSLPSVTLCVCFSFTLSLLSKDPKILLLFQLHQLQSCIWCSLSSSLSFFFKGRNSLCDTIHESKNSRSEKRERERDATSLLLCLPFPLFPHFDRSFCSLLSKVSLSLLASLFSLSPSFSCNTVCFTQSVFLSLDSGSLLNPRVCCSRGHIL